MPGQAAVTIGSREWQVSLATTYTEIMRGLGDLESIPSHTGMLFDMGFTQVVTVTTVPMRFPLDIAFASDDMKVVDLAMDVPPGCLLLSNTFARYFLEVNAGEMADIQIGELINVQATVYPTTLPEAVTEIFDWVKILGMVGCVGIIVNSVVQAYLASPPEEGGPLPGSVVLKGMEQIDWGSLMSTG